jgi:hypothetical protein
MRTRFTELEWTMLRTAPYLAGFGVVMADITISSMIQEMATLAKIIKEVQKRYEHNALIYELMRDKTQLSQEEMQKFQYLPASNLLDLLQQMTNTVERQAGKEDADQYKSFLIEVAAGVASVASEGAFGLTGKISDKERQFLTQLETWLGE